MIRIGVHTDQERQERARLANGVPPAPANLEVKCHQKREPGTTPPSLFVLYNQDSIDLDLKFSILVLWAPMPFGLSQLGEWSFDGMRSSAKTEH